MAPYWGKGGILWLSYFFNEFGDPDFFVWFYFKYIDKLHAWEVSAHSHFGNNYCGITLTEVCTEKYRTEVFFVQTKPVGRGLYKKTEFRNFSVHTEQGRLIKSLLYGSYWYLYLKQTRNAWFEMYISSVVHIWSKKTKITNVFLPFHWKPFEIYILLIRFYVMDQRFITGK
jgi:hypothetical protein